MKWCSRRQHFVELIAFSKGQSWCKLCMNLYNKQQYLLNRDREILRGRKYLEQNREKLKEKCKRYHRTKKGLLTSKYSNMKKRISGKSSNLGDYIYHGLSIMSKEEFVIRSLENEDFNRLFDTWAASGYVLRLSPTPDRINQEQGYIWNNIRWVTMSENCSRTRRNIK